MLGGGLRDAIAQIHSTVTQLAIGAEASRINESSRLPGYEMSEERVSPTRLLVLGHARECGKTELAGCQGCGTEWTDIGTILVEEMHILSNTYRVTNSAALKVPRKHHVEVRVFASPPFFLSQEEPFPGCLRPGITFEEVYL